MCVKINDMKVVAVDDERISLECLEVVLSDIKEIDTVDCFSSANETLKYFESHTPDIAFLDIEMNEMNGLSLAEKIRQKCPSCKIIFVTCTPKYAINAFQLHASGYLVKPLTKADILSELNFLESENKNNSVNNAKSSVKNKLKVQTFGNFEVFINQEPLKFNRSKSKELFAYLIDRKGANCSIGELCAALWENKKDDEALHSQLRKIISDLKNTLLNAGFPDILVKSRGFLAILPEKIECDYYNFLNKDRNAVNAFTGEYMNQYSWSEFTVGYLDSLKN